MRANLSFKAYFSLQNMLPYKMLCASYFAGKIFINVYYTLTNMVVIHQFALYTVNYGNN